MEFLDVIHMVFRIFHCCYDPVLCTHFSVLHVTMPTIQTYNSHVYGKDAYATLRSHNYATDTVM